MSNENDVVEAEFLLSSRPMPEPVPVQGPEVVSHANTSRGENVESSTETAAATGAPAASNSANPQGRKRQRGMNKNRGSYRPEKTDLKLCTATVQGKQCPYGASCKFSHDFAAYRAARLPDLGDTCPIYEVDKYCRFGVTCRFGSAHLTDVPPSGEQAHQQAAHERNTMPAGLAAQLRKHSYDFARANAAARRWEEINVHRSDGAEALDAAGTEDVTEARAVGTDGGKAAECEAAECEAECLAVDSSAQQTAEGVPLSANAPLASAAPLASGDAPLASAAPAPLKSDDHYLSGSAPTRERRPVDFSGKLYLAPLTTVGNLPFRRVCKGYGVDITCSEMALGTNLLQGQASEWALLRRHVSEDVFGVQIAGNSVETMVRHRPPGRRTSPHGPRQSLPGAPTPSPSPSRASFPPQGRVAQLLDSEIDCDFVDINMGCPIDMLCNRGMGAGLATRPNKVQGIVRVMSQLLNCPLTVKMRTGYEAEKPTAHKMIPKLSSWGAAAVTLHGRSRQQRYTKLADWEYISQCARMSTIPLIGNGDVYSFEDLASALQADTGVSAVMIARGALVKPWIFTEVKERRHWDISSSERLEMLRGFVRYGLEHWGTDDLGVARTRTFLLEWLSFLHRYVPVGLLERLPPRIQERPLPYTGRDELETLMASSMASDWIKIAEMLLGPAPADFHFMPKHKSSTGPSAAITAEG